MEIVIIIGIIVIITIIGVVLINPFSQIKKTQDLRSKQDLIKLRNIFEDFYNDKDCYPKPDEVCYDPQENPSSDGTYQCHICGSVNTPDAIKPFITLLPCHPLYPSKKYLYQTNNNTCPTWYRIYTILNNENDPVISEVNCIKNSCGPPYPYIYNYGVSSPNIDLQRSNNFFCAFYNSGSRVYDCNSCISYSSCLINCPDKNRIYSDFQSCCEDSIPNSCGNSFRYCWDTYTNCVSCGNLSECNNNLICGLFGNPPKKKIFKNSTCTIP